MSSQKVIPGEKAYGSIAHLPGSGMEHSDKKLEHGQVAILTSKPRDSKDTIVVQEKLDGSCVAVYKQNGIIIPATRAGYPANSSPYKQHHMFSLWVYDNIDRFEGLLKEGERVVGEWMAQAHGTIYHLPHEPFVVFDLFINKERIPYLELLHRGMHYDFITPKLISYGQPIGIDVVMKKVKVSGHGAINPVEGAVWRCERDGKVDFLGKFVRPDKVNGKYLPEINPEYKEPIWNTYPRV